MRCPRVALAAVFLCAPRASLHAQAVISGRVRIETPSGEAAYLGKVFAFASPLGTRGETLSFESWEAEPAGWYRLSGLPGSYAVVFSRPASFARPLVLTNVHLLDGDRFSKDVAPVFQHFERSESAWDPKPAGAYFQPFVAKGPAVTRVGFRLASDGVDGAGPGSQDLVVSVHRVEGDRPEIWPRIGPELPVLGVDCGGPKNAVWSVGWCSGEVPTAPGKTYAVLVRSERPGGVFQPFFRLRTDASGGAWRADAEGRASRAEADLWLAVAGDGDGLAIPYAKRVHKEFGEFAGFRSRWSQTWVARGRSLAAAILYAAVGGTQPPLSRQRLLVRVREGGPDGPAVGAAKIAVGCGNYTGDASWGVFGAAFAPLEVPLSPGRRYAIEFESLETFETLHGFVNAKGQASDERPGFNPYRKVPPDEYPHGTAYAGGAEAMAFDLDLELVEFESAPAGWDEAEAGPNLLSGGDAEAPEAVVEGAASAGAWMAFRLCEGTSVERAAEWPGWENHVLRVAGAPGAPTADGGFVQRVSGLRRDETYRIRGRVRATWPADAERRCLVGYDPTGQDSDPEAETIRWTALPAVHGVFVPYRSDPVRPAADAISVWLRARSDRAAPFAFRADFDDFGLRRVDVSVPHAGK
ncbi:MAG: hypothetical protein ACUVYA_00820 [Planctomycetota bacterium]